MNHMSIKTKFLYHCLNITFAAEEFIIDDVFCMNELMSFMQLKHS